MSGDLRADVEKAVETQPGRNPTWPLAPKRLSQSAAAQNSSGLTSSSSMVLIVKLEKNTPPGGYQSLGVRVPFARVRFFSCCSRLPPNANLRTSPALPARWRKPHGEV